MMSGMLGGLGGANGSGGTPDLAGMMSGMMSGLMSGGGVPGMPGVPTPSYEEND